MTIEEKQPLMVHCGACSHEWAIAFLPMSISTLAKLSKSPICPMCGGVDVLYGAKPKPTTEGDAEAWIRNGDTGVAWETIWHVLSGYPVRRTGIPRDPVDFGRCYRLLEIMPGWRERLPEVAARYPEWGALVEAWGELTALYEMEMPAGRRPRLYDRMRELRRRAEPSDPAA